MPFFFLDGNSALKGSSSSDPCVATWQWGSYTIIEPSIIPTSILAAIVGVYGFSKISKYTKTVGHVSYSLSFLMFAVMMSDAMFVHCFFDRKSLAGMITGLIDVGLTSSIGMSFLFNGLIDLGILRETSYFTIFSMLATYFGLFVAWIYSFEYNWTQGFLYLYLGTVLFGCGTYCVTELIVLFKSKRFQGTQWLFGGGIAGFVGVLCITKWSAWLCQNWSPLLSGDFMWFLLSDVAMWCLYKYFVINKGQANNATTIKQQKLPLPL